MKKKFRINPVMKKELMVNSRSIKMPLAIMGVNAFLTLIAVLTMAGAGGNLSGYEYSALVVLFPVLGCMECGMISLIVPILTSGSISGEREKQTLDIMLTTPVSPFSIAVGKLGSAMMIVMMYMITSVPIIAIAFVLGGMNWWALLGLFAMLLYIGIYVGSVGIFCSSVVKKSVSATVLTIVIGVAIIIVTTTAFSAAYSIKSYYAMLMGNIQSVKPGMLPMILMFNPYAPFFDFMVRAMSSGSVYEIIKAAENGYVSGQSTGNDHIILDLIYQLWIPISVALNLLIAFGFLKLAARNIAVTRNRKKK